MTTDFLWALFPKKLVSRNSDNHTELCLNFTSIRESRAVFRFIDDRLEFHPQIKEVQITQWMWQREMLASKTNILIRCDCNAMNMLRLHMSNELYKLLLN